MKNKIFKEKKEILFKKHSGNGTMSIVPSSNHNGRYITFHTGEPRAYVTVYENEDKEVFKALLNLYIKIMENHGNKTKAK